MNLRRKASTAAAAGALTVLTALSGAEATAAAPPTAVRTAPVAAAPADADGVTHADNPRVPEGASWSEAYFPSSDGSDVELHADVLRPEHLPADARTPVILSVGPYFAHNGQTGPEGHDRVGPSARFNDLVDGADLMERGYTFVMVDLRGFGGSTGCLDWGGPGEQADVKAAIEWAAAQPWSTGKVGMYGKSYDAVTGLIGNNLTVDRLEAVVAQEPLWNMYPYLYSNRVPRPNVTGTPNAYNSIATMPPMADDTDRYKANATYEATHPECLTDNLTNNQEPDPKADYWKDRNLAEDAAGTSTPLLVTQGFIENNTKPEDMEKYLDRHRGEERGWLGQWEHVRGNDTNAAGQLLMGRAGWFDEVMAFYDQHLRDAAPSTFPLYAIEDNFGAWREQDTWPVVATTTKAKLADGRYVDNGGVAPAAGVTGPATSPFSETQIKRWDLERAPGTTKLTGREKKLLASEAATNHDFWTWSTPTTSAVRITGTPGIAFDNDRPGNVLVRLWDVAPDGTAVMFDENVALLEKGRTAFDLKSTDWTLAKGHQLGVQIGTISSGSWRDTPTGNTITVTNTKLDLQLQDPATDEPTQGDRSPWLDRYLRSNTATLADVGPGSFALTLSRGR